jgi:hypothetical protein
MDLPEDRVAELVTRGDGRIYLIAHITRVAVPAFAAAIEWYWYPPDSERNRLFDVYSTKWAALDWIIIAFPNGRLPAVRRLAKQLGLRLADGVPTVVGNPGAVIMAQFALRPSMARQYGIDGLSLHYFPGSRLANGRDNETIFTVEYDKNSPLYKTKKNDDEAMMQATFEINDLLNRGKKLTPAQIADYIYGSGPFPHVED